MTKFPPSLGPLPLSNVTRSQWQLEPKIPRFCPAYCSKATENGYHPKQTPFDKSTCSYKLQPNTSRCFDETPPPPISNHQETFALLRRG